MSESQYHPVLKPEIRRVYRRLKQRLIGERLLINCGSFPILAKDYDRLFPEADPEGYLAAEFEGAVIDAIHEILNEHGIERKPGTLCQHKEFKTIEYDEGRDELYEDCICILPDELHLHVVYEKTIRPAHLRLAVYDIWLRDSRGVKVLFS